MTIDNFCTKYNLPTYEKQGLREKAKFWARDNFEEKLLILIYILTFGTYPGGLEGSIEEDINSIFSDFIDDSTVSQTKTFSSAKITDLFNSLKPRTYVFDTPSTEWFVVHNLNCKPQVTVIVNDEIVLADVIYTSENSFQVNFTEPQVGSVVI